MLHLLRDGIATQFNCNFSAWEICLFRHIFKFPWSFIFISMNSIFIFLHWIIIQYYFVLLLRLFQCWSLGAFLFGVPPALCILLLWLLWSTFLLSATATYSREIFYVSCPSPKSEFSPRAIIPFVGEWYETHHLWFPQWWVWKSGQEDELLYNFKATQEGKEYSQTERGLKFLFLGKVEMVMPWEL